METDHLPTVERRGVMLVPQRAGSVRPPDVRERDLAHGQAVDQNAHMAVIDAEGHAPEDGVDDGGQRDQYG